MSSNRRGAAAARMLRAAYESGNRVGFNALGDTCIPYRSAGPSAVFRKGGDVELYYEAGGETPGLGYRHDIAVLRAERPGSDIDRPVAIAAPGDAGRSLALLGMTPEAKP